MGLDRARELLELAETQLHRVQVAAFDPADAVEAVTSNYGEPGPDLEEVDLEGLASDLETFIAEAGKILDDAEEADSADE